MVGFDLVVGSSTYSESMAGSDSASLACSALGMLVGSESAHSATKECSHPAILQPKKGNL